MNPIIKKVLYNFAFNSLMTIITSHKLHYVNPCSVYSPISAHTYMLRYAKNHGKELDEVLCDVIQIQDTKKLYS